jgi:hypothetical protein
MNNQVASEKLEQTGFLSLTQEQLWEFFDGEAQKLVGLSGNEALVRIRSGEAGEDLGWTELILLSTLLNHK